MSEKTEGVPQASYPSWIDVPLITNTLRKGGEKNAVVTEITVKRATAAGDHYGSSMHRVTAKLITGDTRSLVIKIPLEYPPEMLGENQDGYEDIMKIFNREAAMLADFIPQMQGLLEKSSPGRWTSLAPKCCEHRTKPNAFIIMEDLCESGFRLANRQKGLGLRHSLLAFRTFARFHAASHAVLKKKPELEKELDNVWRLCGPGFELFTKNGAQAVADVCKTWDGFEEYSALLEKFKDNAMKIFYDLNDPRPGRFNVITHGDCWLNNMMFRYDEDGMPCELRLVDFQISHVASPVTDLLYFLSASVSEDVSTHHQGLLFREYHEALKEALTVLGLECPSFEELMEDVDFHGAYTMINSFNGVPLLKSDHVLDLMASFQGDNSGYIALFNQPMVKRWFQRTLPEYRRKGWLPE